MIKSYRGVKIETKSPIKLYSFQKFFRGFDEAPPIQELWGRKASKILRDLKVEFFSPPFGYMGTSDEDGHLIVSSNHLKTSDLRTIYLDVVHELCHVKQHLAGRPLFDRTKKYVDTPTEIEAYAFTVKEGRRIGMNDAQLYDYLRVEWIDENDLKRLARHVGVSVKRRKKTKPHRARRND